MSKLDEIASDYQEADKNGKLARWAHVNGPLLIRAVRQLGASHLAAMETLGIKNRFIDPDVLELIANLEQEANEQD